MMRCRSRLFELENSLKCLNSHCFDKARQGYVNLLMKNSSGKRHGDDRLMVLSRRNFLEKGYYAPLRDAVENTAGIGHTILDAGCGEGYYTKALAKQNTVYGIDISKDALKLAALSSPNSAFAVASISDIPLEGGAVDTVVSIFAPDSPDEFLRVLKSGGRLITVQPMERHLWGLKCAVYDKPYLNPPLQEKREGFELISRNEIKYSITLNCNEDIIALFKMTPYYYKTSAADQAKPETLGTLTTELEFLILEYGKV